MKRHKMLTGNFHKCHVKKGDKVKIITGDHKGKIGSIKKVCTKFIKGPKVKVEGINLIKKKIRAEQSKFAFIDVEVYIDASNVRKI